MKLRISFDNIEQDKILEVASQVAKYADAIEIGPFLLYKHGTKLIESLIQTVPEIVIAADAKIISRGKEISQLMVDAGATWVTVMAGTDKEVIHNVCSTLHANNRKAMLDVRDTASAGQSALEAKSLGIDAILFQAPYELDNPVNFIDKWDMLRGNTQLPIYISTKVTRENIHKIIEFQPAGIIVGQAITGAQDPAAEAEFFKNLCD